LSAAWISGALLLMAGCTALSVRLCRDARAGVVQTEAYAALVRLIRGQIACYSRPFGEISRRIPPPLRQACGLPVEGGTLEAMLGAAKLQLPADAERIVRAFAAELGKSYKAEQLAVCDAAAAELDAIAAALRRHLPEKLRLIRCACICGGLAVIFLCM